MIFYKYRDFTNSSKKRTLEIINKRELFFSSIESFNDPFDGKVYLRFDGKLNEIKAAQIRTQYTMNLLTEGKYEGINIEAVKKLVDERITEDFVSNSEEIENRISRIQKIHNNKGVLSLSTQNSNILMWSHYTYNHKGLCFGFEFSEEAFSNPKRIRYQTHYDDIWGWLHTDDEVVERILLSKAIDWQYEDEYRIIRETVGVEKYEAETLKEIIFGSMMSEEDKMEVKKECEKAGLKPIFKQATLDIERYKINIEEYHSNNCL